MSPRPKVRADVVGSLLRPAELRSRRQPEHDADVGSGERRELEDRAVVSAVARQIAAGLDVVSDGELRRYMFQDSFWDSVRGYSRDRNPVEFRADDGSTITWNVQRIEERLARHGENRAAAEAAFVASITDHPFKVTFPAASLFALPFTFKPGINDHAYADLAELVEHCITIEKELIAEAVAAGAREIQLDFPAYPYFVDPAWIAAMADIGWSVADALELAVAADTAVVADIPEDVAVTMHVCRGNNQSRYLCEGALDPVADALFSLPYHRFLVEWEDPDRMGDFGALRSVPSPGPTVVLGLVSSKRPELETADAVVSRIEAAAGLLDIDQLALSTQCGFASTSPGNEVTEDDQWAKLDLVGAVADEVWGR